MVFEKHLNYGYNVINPGNLKTEWPHAGILNTFAFLQRYPTTPTNRNRARSRWTYYHFLGVDIEKSASRTTDPVALADKDNPTLKNTACTVCHKVLDPVAGAFQNYGQNGAYRQAWGGLDSLDSTLQERHRLALRRGGHVVPRHAARPDSTGWQCQTRRTGCSGWHATHRGGQAFRGGQP